MNPPTIDHFVGQRRVVRRFQVALEAAWGDGTRLPHMLLTGPPGVGKTTLAHLAAKEKLSLLLKRFGFEDRTAHAFRHFFVSDLLRRGCQPHVVQALARHRDARTTLQVYAHPHADDLRSAVNRRVG